MIQIVVPEHIQADSVGNQILFSDLGIDWQALGLTLVLRVMLGTSTPRDLPLNPVLSQPLQAFHQTTAASFPDAGIYTAQVVAKNGTAPERYSGLFKIEVKPNL